jgi:type IV pilus assembly protein PilE
MRPRRGFTLVEMMIVVLVLAIIASIAVPSYRSYVVRAQRSDATATLLKIRTAEEKFFLQNTTYTTEFGPAGLRMMPGATTTLTTENGYYTVQVAIPDPTPGATPQSFLVTATPVAGGPQASDAKCTSFSLNSDGLRNSSPSPIATCWK